jgi:circadian clock protein KaiB
MARIHDLQMHRARRISQQAHYRFRLYTTGITSRSTRALRNLMELCEGRLKGHYDLEVVDIYQEPGRASEAQIIAAPTLIKEEPPPVCRLVGDLSDGSKVLQGLGLSGRSR